MATKTLTDEQWVELFGRIKRAGGIPTVVATPTYENGEITGYTCPDTTGLADLDVMILKISGSVPANKDVYLSDGTTSLLLVAQGNLNYLNAKRELSTSNAAIVAVKDNNKLLLNAPANPRIPVYQTTWNAAGSGYTLIANEDAAVPFPAVFGEQFIFVTDSAHTSDWLNLMVIYNTSASQYKLVYATNEGLEFVKSLPANTPYKATFIPAPKGSSDAGGRWVLLDMVPSGGAEPSFRKLFDTTVAQTVASKTYELTDGVAYTNRTKIYIDFTWTSTATGELSVYPMSTGYVANGTEVYTSGTTRSAIKRTNWPLGGKISNIKRYDSVHMEIDFHPGEVYDSDWGELMRGITAKSAFYKTQNFYEGTFYSDVYSSFGSGPSDLILQFNTTPQLENFSLKVDTFGY